MAVNGQPHILANLALGKSPSLSTEQEARWFP